MRPATCWLLLAASAALSPVAAQQFEVASIRPSGPQSVRGSDGGPGHKDPTRYSFGQATMLDLIWTAWDLRGSFQISGTTPIDRDKFDLMATVPAGATKEEFRAMLQNLLKDRFGLKMHMESREFPAYELVIAKGGIKFSEAVPGEPAPPSPAGWPDLPPNAATMVQQNTTVSGYSVVRIKAQAQPISAFLIYVRTADNQPVVDKTGLTGKYNLTLEYANDLPGPAPAGPSPVPSVFTAIQQQLGLQLVAKKLPFDVVVVESFTRTPTEN